jgi:hypothetical protein
MEPNIQSPMADVQASIPPERRYNRDEMVTRLQLTFEELMKTGVHQASNSKILHTKQVQSDINIPLFGVLAQWMQLQIADLLRYVQANMAEGEVEAVVGIPPQLSEDILAALEGVREWLVKDIAEAEGKTVKLDAIRAKAKRAISDLQDVMGAVDDLTLEEGDLGEGEGDEYEPLLSGDEGEEEAAAEEDKLLLGDD